MSLYEEQFDTEWETLTRDEAMMRAFALGVADSMGQPHDEEYAAIKAEMATKYDASIVELAYEEGKGKTSQRMQETDARGMTLWRKLLTEELDIDHLDLDEEIDLGEIDFDMEDIVRPTDFPSAVADRTEAIDKPDLDPKQTDYPEFLE